MVVECLEVVGRVLGRDTVGHYIVDRLDVERFLYFGVGSDVEV